jgi:hypothetical protein
MIKKRRNDIWILGQISRPHSRGLPGRLEAVDLQVDLRAFRQGALGYHVGLPRFAGREYEGRDWGIA